MFGYKDVSAKSCIMNTYKNMVGGWQRKNPGVAAPGVARDWRESPVRDDRD